MSGFRGLDNAPPSSPGAILGFLTQVRDVVNNLLRGKLNATLDVTLNANAASTTVQDPRIGGASGIYLSPLSANAAAEIGAGGIYIASLAAQTAVIAHANNAQTDRRFRLQIIGG